LFFFLIYLLLYVLKGTYDVPRLMPEVAREYFEKNSSSFKSSGREKPISLDTNLYLSTITTKELARIGPGSFYLI
jgi:hypothetical protein